MTTSEAPLGAEPLCEESLGREPLWDEAEFAALCEGLVADFAPRLFALVEEAGERLDGRILAWGMAFEDHAQVVGADRAFRGKFRSAESARELFSRYAKMRLVWYNPEAATQDDDAA